jgi:hypothetical protein
LTALPFLANDTFEAPAAKKGIDLVRRISPQRQKPVAAREHNMVTFTIEMRAFEGDDTVSSSRNNPDIQTVWVSEPTNETRRLVR